MSTADATGSLGRGPRSLLGSALAAAATCGSLLALSRLIDPGSWLPAACTAVVLLAALTAAVRAAGRAAWLPSVVGLVAGVLGVLVQYGGPRAGTPTLPSLDAFRHTRDLFREGLQLIQDSLVPMAAERSAELVIVVAAIGVFLLVDALALGADTPALAAVPLVTFWTPAVFLGFPTSGWAIFWTGLAYLLLLALSVAPAVGDTARVRQAGAIAAGAAATLVVALALGPVVSAFPAWASVNLPDLGPGAIGPVQLSDSLDLRESLGRRSQQTVLTFTVTRAPDPAATATPSADEATPADGATPVTAAVDAGGTAAVDAGAVATPSPTPTAVAADSRAVGPLRAFTVSDFDGRQWHRDTSGRDLADWDQARLIGPGARAGEVPDPLDPQVVQVDVTIGALEQAELPISAFPRALQVDGPWQYDAVDDEVVGRRPTSDGLEYRMQVLVPGLTGEDLRDAAVGTPPGDGDYLAVPDTEHLADVEALARQVVAGATTPYAQAMALQGYFRSTSNFTYDTQVPPARSGDAVWDFLTDRRGYCVQFATAMAVMARTLGIPTRVAVGFLPGDAQAVDGGTRYTVTGRQAHAWPELYFERYGWVRFEPTPATQTGVPPVWSDPLADLSTLPTGGPGDFQDPEAGQGGPVALPTVGPAGAGTGTGRGAWVPLAAILGVLAAVGVAALVVRRLRRPVELTCEHAWHQARRALERHAAIGWSDATTPRGAVHAVQAAFEQRAGRPLDPAAVEALKNLAHAVEQERYAPRPATPTSAELHRWLGTVKHAVDEVSDRSRRGGGPTALRAGS